MKYKYNQNKFRKSSHIEQRWLDAKLNDAYISIEKNIFKYR